MRPWPWLGSGCCAIPAAKGWPRPGTLARPQPGGSGWPFWISDDLWLPEKLARQISWLEGQPELLICQTDETWVRRGVRVRKPVAFRKVAGQIFLPSLARCMISPSAVMLHRRLLQDHGVFDAALPVAEDYDLWLRLTWRYEVGRVDEPRSSSGVATRTSSRPSGVSTGSASGRWSSCWPNRTCPSPMPGRPAECWPPNAPLSQFGSPSQLPAATGNPASRHRAQPLTSTRTFENPRFSRNSARSLLRSQVSPSQ